MTALAALLDVTAERGGAATLDRGHGMPLRGRQRRAMLITESRAEVAEMWCTTFATFALFDPDDHALAVDRAGLEADRFRNP
jgi:hypothetical protein